MQHGSPPELGAARRPLFTTTTAAHAVGCDVVTIRRAIHAGELRALRLGSHGDYRIDAADLQHWLRAHELEEPAG